MSTLRRTVALAAIAAGLAASLAGTASAATIAEPARATPVDADRSGAVWSDYDDGIKAFRLVYRSPGGATKVLPAAPSPDPFDADLGDDAQRHRVVAYSACPSGLNTCDVRVIRVSDGRDEPVPEASRPGVWEYSPTISRGQLAWAVGGGLDERPRVLLQRLGATGTPRALPVLPRRRCFTDYDGRYGCRAVNGIVSELELRGDTLGQSVMSSVDGDTRNIELRLVGLDRGTSKQLYSAGVGESGQSFIGVSIDGNALYAYKACFGDPSGCDRRAGTLRYAFGTGRLDLAEDSRQLSGFTVDRGRVLAADGGSLRYCEIEQGNYPGLPGQKIGPCPIEERALPTRWTRVRRR